MAITMNILFGLLLLFFYRKTEAIINWLLMPNEDNKSIGQNRRNFYLSL